MAPPTLIVVVPSLTVCISVLRSIGIRFPRYVQLSTKRPAVTELLSSVAVSLAVLTSLGLWLLSVACMVLMTLCAGKVTLGPWAKALGTVLQAPSM